MGIIVIVKDFLIVSISHLHIVVAGKFDTHIIESVNSNIRANLVRFNRRNKRFSKTLEMLDNTILLFFHYKKYKCHIK